MITSVRQFDGGKSSASRQQPQPSPPYSTMSDASREGSESKQSGARRRPPALQLVNNAEDTTNPPSSASTNLPTPHLFFADDMVPTDDVVAGLRSRIATLEVNNDSLLAQVTQLKQQCEHASLRAHQWQQEAQCLHNKLTTRLCGQSAAATLGAVPPARQQQLSHAVGANRAKPQVDKNENVLIKPMSPDADDVAAATTRQQRGAAGMAQTHGFGGAQSHVADAHSQPLTVAKPYVACNYDYERDEYSGGSKGIEAHVYVPARSVAAVAQAFYKFRCDALCANATVDFTNAGGREDAGVPLTVVKVSAPNWHQTQAAANLLSTLAQHAVANPYHPTGAPHSGTGRVSASAGYAGSVNCAPQSAAHNAFYSYYTNAPEQSAYSSQSYSVHGGGGEQSQGGADTEPHQQLYDAAPARRV